MKELICALLLLFPALSINEIAVLKPTVDKEPYPFIDYSRNHIDFPSQVKFEGVYELLDSAFAGTRSFNILHFGGSHVQAGSIGVRMRQLLEQLSWGITNERGWLFPYRVGNSNSTQNTRSEATGEWTLQRCASNKDHAAWGMGGIVVSTATDSATLKIWAWKPDSSNYRGNEVRLFYNMQIASYTPTWVGAENPVSTRIDSTLGCIIHTFEQEVDTLHWQFVQTDSVQIGIEVQGCQLLSQEHGITYNEIGVNGASTASYLRCEQMEMQLPSIKPDLVIFGIGINDAHVPQDDFSSVAFTNRYDSLIAVLRTSNPEVRFLFLTNNDSYYKKRHPNQNASSVRTCMYSLAEKHGAAVWDLFEIMGGLGSIKSWEDEGLAKSDYIHLTRQGYYLQAELLFQAFMQSYGDHLQEKHGMLQTTKPTIPN
ncbi:MAG: hypothetical protein GC193_12640 [Cryomorphaceae bacterium]|nr:hypothetical protein [Cryomorphaceae bacterium]